MTDDSGRTRRRPTGRRAGDSGTRDAVLDAARELFALHGYDGASMRAIAAQAGVDPALIRHFFGDKQGLFAQTMASRTVIPQRLATAVRGPVHGLGERVADAYLSLWEEEDTRPLLLSMLRSAMTTQAGAALLQEVLGTQVAGPAEGAGAMSQAQRRGLVLAGSHLLGLAITRHVLALPEVVEIPREELVRRVAPAIQDCLTADG